MEIIIASNNQGKIKEFKNILEKKGYTVLSQKEADINLEVEETGTSFAENARFKSTSNI